MKDFLMEVLHNFELSFYPLLIIFLILTHINENLLFSRIAGTSGHTMVWIMISLFGLYVVNKNNKKSLWNSVRNFSAVLLTMAMIEGIFHPFYIAYDVSRVEITHGSRMGILVGLTLGFFTKSYALFDKKRFLIASLLFTVFMLVWWMVGLPVTIDFNKTEFFYDPFVNFLELSHWGFGLLVFGWAFQKDIHDLNFPIPAIKGKIRIKPYKNLYIFGNNIL